MRKFTVFLPGQVVEVIPEHRESWVALSSNNQDSIKYTIDSVRLGSYLSSSGHTQELTMTDGTVASGWWFDEHSPANDALPDDKDAEDDDFEYYEESE